MSAATAKASAPGKLFLFGEYGVLAGGSCVVAAVGRRVVAERRQEASGYETRGARLDEALALPESVLVEAGVEGIVAASQLATDIRPLYVPASGESGHAPAGDGRREKLGLGSSAASVVALTAVCLAEVGSGASMDAWRPQLFERAHAAHRRLQGGRGSGADVAASSFGGIIGYQLGEPPEPFAGLFDPPAFGHEAIALSSATVVPKLALPVGLRVEPIWLGRPARSTSFVRRCEQALEEAFGPTRNALSRTAEIAHSAVDALVSGDVSGVVALVEQADEALEALGEVIEAPIITDSHRQLRQAARPYAISVKPSGAGGGDFSLAVGPLEADWERFLARLPERCRHIRLELGVEGVRFEA